MPNKRFFVVLCGLPAVGKSYSRNALKAYMKLEDPTITNDDIVVCSSDDVLDRIAAETGKDYDSVFKQHIADADLEFWGRMLVAMTEGKTVIVDRTNLTVKSRARILNAFQPFADFYEPPTCVYITAPAGDRKRRLVERSNLLGKTIPQAILDSMEAAFVEPSISEGFTGGVIRSNNTDLPFREPA